MVYEPKTDAGKEALANGADIAIVEEMEKNSELPSDDSSKAKELSDEEKAIEEKRIGDENEAKGLNRDGSKKEPAGDEGDEGNGDDGDKTPNRNATHMPIWKHKEELKKAEDRVRGEMSTKIQDLETKVTEFSKSGGATDADIKSIADEFGLAPEVASAMVEKMSAIVEKKLGTGEIRKTLEKTQELAQAKAEEDGFNNELMSQDTQKTIDEVAPGKEITPAVKAKIKEFAYSTTYARYRLADIIRLEAGQIFNVGSKESKSGEAGRGGSNRGAVSKSISEMSPDEIDSMSDDEFLQASNELGGKNSRFTKITKPKGK